MSDQQQFTLKFSLKMKTWTFKMTKNCLKTFLLCLKMAKIWQGKNSEVGKMKIRVDSFLLYTKNFFQNFQKLDWEGESNTTTFFFCQMFGIMSWKAILSCYDVDYNYYYHYHNSDYFYDLLETIMRSTEMKMLELY